MKEKKPADQTKNEDQDVGPETSKAKDTLRSRRRALLGAISAVGATQLPKQWTRPVVDHVLLPAHAQGSPPPPLEDLECAIACTRAETAAVTTSISGTLLEVTLATVAAATCSRQPDGFTESGSADLTFSASGSTDDGTLSSFTTITGTFTAESTSSSESQLFSPTVTGAGTQTTFCAGDLDGLIDIILTGSGGG